MLVIANGHCCQEVKELNCAFFDKSTKLCMLVDLKVLNNSGYRGIAEKVSNRYKPVLIENAGVSIFFNSIRVNYPCNFLKKIQK